jgi:uncharacterized DUF497 family protein
VFEWDDEKSIATLAARGIDFTLAAGIFEGEVLRRADERRDYGEPRWIAIGQVSSETFTVVYTHRGERIRIISARRANRRERRAYRGVFEG